MNKQTIEGQIFFYVPLGTYTFSECDISCDKFVRVTKSSLEFEVPQDFDPTRAQLAALDEEERAARLKLAEALASIDGRRSKLQAIEYTPEAA